jgi:hypothetical protein
MNSEFGIRNSEFPPTHPAAGTAAPQMDHADHLVGHASRVPGGRTDRASSIEHPATLDRHS